MARQAIELDILGLPPAVSLEYPNQEAMDQRFLLAQKQREGVALRRQELALRQMAEMQELPTPTPTPTLNPDPNHHVGMAHLAVALRTNSTLHTLKLARAGAGPVGGATMLDCLRHHNATLRALALDGNPLLTPALQAALDAQLRDNKVRAALGKAAGDTALTLRGLSLQPPEP